VSLGARELALLRRLATVRGHVVPRESLFRAAWPDEPYAPNRLHAYVRKLRRRLEDDADVLETVPGRGYRIRVVDPASAAPTSGPEPVVA
jgi:DNA-binding winged helix-turn-helix (wHTH) protein